MPQSIALRRASQLALAFLLAVVVAVALVGCGSAGTNTGGPQSRASSEPTSAGEAQTLNFDLAASHVGRPRTTPESTLIASWLPPRDLTGLRQVTDKKQIAELTRVASSNEKFWIERPNDLVQPIVFDTEAVSLLATSTGFSTAQIIPVRDVAAPKKGATPQQLADLKAAPTAYQVLLSGDVGDTSFGLRKGAKPDEWLLDPNGELVNLGGAIDAVGRDASFVADQLYVTHTAFDLGGRAAIYLTWAVFRDTNGKQYAVALHNPPPIKATWSIAGGQPLHIGTAYPPATVYGPVVITPTK